MNKVLLASIFAFAPLTLQAQSVVGQFSSCGNINASGNLAMASNAVIPANSLVIASVAVDTQTTGNTFGDNQGGTNYNASVVAGFCCTNVVIQFTRYIVSAMPSGTTFTWHMDSGGVTGHKACINITAFSSMVAQAFPTTNGTNGGTSAAPTVTAVGPPAGSLNLVFVSNSFLTDPGTVSGAGITMLNKNCILPFCIRPGYKVVANAATPTITLGSTSSAAWVMGLGEYAVDDTLFADDFEYRRRIEIGFVAVGKKGSETAIVLALFL